MSGCFDIKDIIRNNFTYFPLRMSCFNCSTKRYLQEIMNKKEISKTTE